jgi:peptidoglycan hydrolase CwlO-like protein
MTPEQRKQIETQIQNEFAEIQKTLENLKNEVQLESDEAKKQEKNEEINRLESEAAELKTKIDTLKSLNEQDLESLKTRLESFKTTIQDFK